MQDGIREGALRSSSFGGAKSPLVKRRGKREASFGCNATSPQFKAEMTKAVQLDSKTEIGPVLVQEYAYLKGLVVPSELSGYLLF